MATATAGVARSGSDSGSEAELSPVPKAAQARQAPQESRRQGEWMSSGGVTEVCQWNIANSSSTRTQRERERYVCICTHTPQIRTHTHTQIYHYIYIYIHSLVGRDKTHAI